jgi:protein SCO1/2
MSRALPRLCACFLLLAGLPAGAAEDAVAFAFHQQPGRRLPLEATLHDEAGRDTSLGKLGGGAPLVLAFGYFRCPNLCGVVREDLFSALARAGLAAARDYQLAFVSIDPAEAPADAARAKADDLARFPADPGGWHFLTGSRESLEAVEVAAGFRARFDDAQKQFLHPAGVVFATADGAVSGYLLGVGYSPGDVQAALSRAARGEIGQAASPILLLCFHFDAVTGRYTLAIMKVLRLAAGVTVLMIGVVVALAHRRRCSGATA